MGRAAFSVSIDSIVLEDARKAAEGQKLSLSRLVEQSLTTYLQTAPKAPVDALRLSANEQTIMDAWPRMAERRMDDPHIAMHAMRGTFALWEIARESGLTQGAALKALRSMQTKGVFHACMTPTAAILKMGYVEPESEHWYKTTAQLIREGLIKRGV
jgi:hypothetical protein